MRTALIGGGAGVLGSHLAGRLADLGYAVTVADVSEEALRRLPDGIATVTADLTRPDGCQRAVDASRRGGPLDVLVNAMGISPKKNGARRPFLEIGLAEWERVLAVNLTAPFLLCQKAIPHVSRDGEASIVNIVSGIGKIGASGPDPLAPPYAPSGAHYGASKAALHNLTISLARELAPLGIRCNAVAPGQIGSGMGDSTDPELHRRMLSQIPLRRAGTVPDVTYAVEFLINPAANYITGETIDVNGGWIAD